MKTKLYNLRYFIILLCALIRTGLYGFHFYPVLDDWVQYGTFSLEPHPWRDIFVGLGYWTFRPMSWIFDISLWSHISFLLPILMTLMHAFSCILFLRVAEKLKFKLGIPFIIVYMFLPLNTEATMWMSASTRIIVPLFLTALALNFVLAASNNKSKGLRSKSTFTSHFSLLTSYYILFALCQLVAFFIYEQVAIIGFIFAILVGLRTKKKPIWIITLANTAIVFAYYIIFLPYGPAIERAAVVGGQLLGFWQQFKLGFGWVAWEIFARGFVRGSQVLLQKQNWAYFILIVLASLTFGLLSHKKFSSENPSKPIAKIILGASLFILTLVPFIVISGNSLALRNIFVSCIGLAFVVDGLVDLIPKKDLFLPAISGIVVFMFIVSGISELTDYRATSLLDRNFALGIAPQAMQEYFYMERIPSLLPEQNAYYVEHIGSITSVDWAITGAIRYLTGNLQVPTVKVVWDPSQMPVSKD